MNEMERLHRQAKRYKELYPTGTRLCLINMDDPYASVPSGTRGTVDLVDDIGQIHMTWDNGRTLALVPEVDSFRKLSAKELAEEGREDNVEVGAAGGLKKEAVLFASLLPEPMGSALDAHFKKNGWELQAWDTGKAQGYQVFFGDGVQVDNHYEYGFSYLYDKEELLAFAEGFYQKHILGEPIYVAIFNYIGSGNELLSSYEKELAARTSKECSVSLVNGDTLCFYGVTGQEISALMEATGADYNYSYASPEAAWNVDDKLSLEDQIQAASSIAEQGGAADKAPVKGAIPQR